MKKVTLDVLIDVKTDIEALWAEIGGIETTHLGGRHGQYSVSFIGSQKNAFKVLNKCLEYSHVGKFFADYIDA